MLKKEYSYNSIPSLGLYNLFYGEFNLYAGSEIHTQHADALCWQRIDFLHVNILPISVLK